MAISAPVVLMTVLAANEGPKKHQLDAPVVAHVEAVKDATMKGSLFSREVLAEGFPKIGDSFNGEEIKTASNGAVEFKQDTDGNIIFDSPVPRQRPFIVEDNSETESFSNSEPKEFRAEEFGFDPRDTDEFISLLQEVKLGEDLRGLSLNEIGYVLGKFIETNNKFKDGGTEVAEKLVTDIRESMSESAPVFLEFHLRKHAEAIEIGEKMYIVHWKENDEYEDFNDYTPEERSGIWVELVENFLKGRDDDGVADFVKYTPDFAEYLVKVGDNLPLIDQLNIVMDIEGLDETLGSISEQRKALQDLAETLKANSGGPEV
ncbi:hypothetical protein N9J72_02075 [Candidatus Gracilibacteria bacterium]|nr:hypothetical protein [Candidatus Gracilibacteria bacterium]